MDGASFLMVTVVFCFIWMFSSFFKKTLNSLKRFFRFNFYIFIWMFFSLLWWLKSEESVRNWLKKLNVNWLRRKESTIRSTTTLICFKNFANQMKLFLKTNWDREEGAIVQQQLGCNLQTVCLTAKPIWMQTTLWGHQPVCHFDHQLSHRSDELHKSWHRRNRWTNRILFIRLSEELQTWKEFICQGKS